MSSSDGRLAGLPACTLPGGLVVREARTAAQRGRGLAGVGALPPGHGLLLHRCRSVHTLGMRFALDLVWLDCAGAVVRVDTGVGRRRVRTCLRACDVLECNAGEGAAFAAALRGR